MAAVISRNDPSFDEVLLDRASVAFGVFDGVHEGHRFIIGEAVNTAREEGRPSAIITFDIDPDEVFAADRLKKLMTNETRIAKLAELDADAVVVLPFSREFAAQSPEDFLNTCFGSGVPSHIHIGSDFHFGRKAAGNVGIPATFADTAKENIEVHILDFDQDIYGQPIEVEFVEWLRPMRVFESTDELIATVMGNIAWVRENL